MNNRFVKICEVRHWSRRPGIFLDKDSGVAGTASSSHLPQFTGSVIQWYELLPEILQDCDRCSCAPEVLSMFEMCDGFRAHLKHLPDNPDEHDGEIWRHGFIYEKHLQIYVDPLAPRNLIAAHVKGQRDDDGILILIHDMIG